MNKAALKNKIENYDWWLTSNPNHPDYKSVLADKIALERQLAEMEYDKPG